MRVKRSVQTFTGKYQVLAVAFSDAGDQVCFGSPFCAAFSSAQPPCVCELQSLQDMHEVSDEAALHAPL